MSGLAGAGPPENRAEANANASPDGGERLHGAAVPGDLHGVLARLSERSGQEQRYRVEGRIDRGASGLVDRIWDRDLRRRLARKTLACEFPDERTQWRFLEEAQINAQLSHPGIVPVHEVGLDAEGRLYFQMPLVRGRTFRRVLDDVWAERDGWTRTRALGVLLRVCETMAYAHSRAVVHRDLKPSNLMVGRFGEVFVMDWGLARVVGDPRRAGERPTVSSGAGHSVVLTDRRDAACRDPDSPAFTQQGDVLGTPYYMAPEQAYGDVAHVGPSADVYAIGAMLYELLSGHPPYGNKGKPPHAAGVLSDVQTGPPVPVAELSPDAPPELLAICERAMDRDLGRRLSTAESLAGQLRAFLERRVVSVYATGPLAEFSKWIGRNRATATASAAFLLAAFLVLGLVQQWRIADVAREKVFMRAAYALSGVITRADRGWRLVADSVPEMEAWLDEARRLVVEVRSGLDELIELRARAISSEVDTSHPLVVRERELVALISAFETHRASDRALAESRSDPPTPEAQRALRSLAVLNARIPVLEGKLAHARRRIELARAWRFEGVEDQARHDHLTDLADNVQMLDDHEYGRIARVEHWRDAADAVAARSLQGAAGDRWAAALASISANPLYAGIDLVPQLGLVPLREDSQTGLWVFWHILSGEQPAFDAHGRLSLGGETGIVFVLLPGGQMQLGCQGDQPDQPLYDRYAEQRDLGLIDVDLAPFFMSRYELTQAQWTRLASENQSYYRVGTQWQGQDRISSLHPIESVTWTKSVDALDRWGLLLPTEAQWEYAARGGTSQVFWWGDALEQRENCYAEKGLVSDGWDHHAPVNRFDANPFGLYGVLGNVREWCRDAFAPKDHAAQERRPGDGLVVSDIQMFRIIRGGGFDLGPSWMRCSSRAWARPEDAKEGVGLRPCRALDM